jgi:hypothetical protein
MAAQASFDVTSPVDFQEVDNALNQARKEVGQRYDFKGAKAEIILSTTDKTLTHRRRQLQDGRALGGRADPAGAAERAGEELQGRRS